MDVDKELMEKSLNDSCQALVSGDKPQLETWRSARLFLNIFGAVGPEPVHVTMVLAVDFFNESTQHTRDTRSKLCSAFVN